MPNREVGRRDNHVNSRKIDETQEKVFYYSFIWKELSELMQEDMFSLN